jgi:glycosyltransferase involved in cell wall biosynthesis
MTAACSLLISTYNWPAALQLCLKSVLQQSFLPAEIIIADDGSKEDTKEVIDEFKNSTSIPVIHVWHPDEGFQLAKIRNRAIVKATQPYIIQIDGDLILHKHFIKDHLNIKEKGFFVSGSRVLLSKETSEALLKNNSIDVSRHNVGEKNSFNKWRSGILRKFLSTRYKTSGRNKFYVKGCNMAFWKDDLIKVNGYNEIFTGWGREDSEIAIRLFNTGIQKKFLKMGGITFHIFHKEASRDNEATNVSFMEDAITQKKTWAEKGLDQYLPAVVK